MGEIFGTDGVRGVANGELTPELAFRLGRVAAHVLSGKARRPRLLVGRDTRLSGDLLEASLTAGILSVGGEAWLAGVTPTPAVAYLTRAMGFEAGMIISASHNPMQDNGIKLVGPDGFKLPDAEEESMERLLLASTDDLPRPVGVGLGRVHLLEKGEGQYLDFVKKAAPVQLKGLKIIVDCANGAAYQTTPRLLVELGATVEVINGCPDGANINARCGSTYPEDLQRAVVERQAHLGLAHDGDADRLLAVDARGNLVDGDQILLACGLYLKERGELPNNRVVVTVMSNLGLHQAFQKAGVEVLVTKVGDRYVLEEMKSRGAALGGEQSGHIIFLASSTTGDGLITALQLLRVMVETGRSLEELAGAMRRLPQVLTSVRVARRISPGEDPLLATAMARAEERLRGRGRLLVRPSGTEPLLRIMAEGPDETELWEIVEELAGMVKARA